MKTNDESYDRIRDEKVKHDISREPAKYQHYLYVKLIKINILEVTKNYFPIKTKPRLFITKNLVNIKNLVKN